MGIRDEIEKQGQDIERLADTSESLRKKQIERADRLDAQVEALSKMASELGLDIDLELSSAAERPERRTLPADLAAAAGCLDEATLARLDEEFQSSVESTVPLDDLDRFVLMVIGLVTPLAVQLRQGEKPPGFWDEILAGEPLTAEKRRRVLIDWRRVNERWYGDLADVPSAATELGAQAERVLGSSERGRRMAGSAPVVLLRELVEVLGAPSLDELDASPAGPDGERGDSTAQAVNPVEDTLRWLAKLLRDVAEPLGLEIDESLSRRLLDIPLPGVAADHSVSDLVGLSHTEGDVVRAYLVDATVPAAVEGLVRMYARLRYPDAFQHRPEEHLPGARTDIRYVRARQRDRILASRLFWAHAIAAGVNLGQVAVAGVRLGAFWETVRTVNVAQWQTFAAHTINRIASDLEDTTVEQIVENRRRIEARWEELLEPTDSTRRLYAPRSPGGPTLQL